MTTPNEYVEVLQLAGFVVSRPADFTKLVLDTLRAAAKSPRPVNLAAVMGEGFGDMFANLMAAVHSQKLAPVLVAASKT